MLTGSEGLPYKERNYVNLLTLSIDQLSTFSLVTMTLNLFCICSFLALG